LIYSRYEIDSKHPHELELIPTKVCYQKNCFSRFR